MAIPHQFRSTQSLTNEPGKYVRPLDPCFFLKKIYERPMLDSCVSKRNHKNNVTPAV